MKRIFSFSLIQNELQLDQQQENPAGRWTQESQRTEEQTQGAFDLPEYFYSDYFYDIF